MITIVTASFRGRAVRGRYPAAVAVVATVAVEFLLPWSSVSAAEPALPKIRDFDIATIERLGREMYAQDQFAWKATDIALAKRGGERGLSRDGMKGWITESGDGKDLVRFIRIGAKGPQALYDVTFVQGREPTFTTPEDTTLTAEQLSQYNARMLALKNVDKPCAGRYNTVALKDAESDGWLVWALASTTDPDLIVIRGHYRFTVSADGNVIRAKDALSTSCNQISKKEMSRDAARLGAGKEASVFSNHIVSLSPIETQVFASFAYQTTIHIGTNDGKAWKIDKDRVTNVEQDDPGLDGSAARVLAGIEEVCSVMASKLNENPKRYYLGKGLTKVIEVTEHAEKFTIKVDNGFQAEGLVCGRADIIPSPNDYKVLAAGLNLSIFDRDAGHADRMGKLELVDGKVQFTIVKGEQLTEALSARLIARVGALQKAIQTQH